MSVHDMIFITIVLTLGLFANVATIFFRVNREVNPTFICIINIALFTAITIQLVSFTHLAAP